ncbi:MAG: hypothetical protein RL757_2364 [Bacteroidota bacterium]|jgi:hypothetical protein
MAEHTEIMPEEQPEMEQGTTPSSEKTTNQPVRRTWFGRILRGIGRLAWWFCIALFLFVLVFRIPAVQQWAMNRVTGFLSKELGTTVRVASFHVDYFDVITLGDLYVADKQGDTLLFCRELTADFRYLKALTGKIQFDGFLIREGELNIKRDSGQIYDSFQFVLDYFDPPPAYAKPRNTPPNLVIGNVQLRDGFHFRRLDYVRGQRIDGTLLAADIHTNFMNMQKQMINFRDVKLARPIVKLEKITKHPLSDSLLAIKNAPPQYRDIGGTLLTKNDWDSIRNLGYRRPQLSLGIGSLQIVEGQFSLDNFRKSPKKMMPDDVLDYHHLDIYDIEINANTVLLTDEKLTASLEGARAQEQSGFKLEKLAASVEISDTKMSFDDLQLITPSSSLSNSFSLQYRDFDELEDEFEEKVIMRGNFVDSKVALKDIMFFAKELKGNQFFEKNKNEVATLNGQILGRVSQLITKDMSIQLKNNLKIVGDFKFKNINTANEENLTLKFKKLQTDIKTLQQLIPNFKANPQIDRLGNLNFEGEFEGFLDEFLLKGTLKTDIGRVGVKDFGVTWRGTTQNRAKYSGGFDIEDLNLAALTNNNDLGKVSVEGKIKNGVGLTKESFKADLEATVANFMFKNYNYNNFDFSGKVNTSSFEGHLVSRDANADFNFDGTINFSKPDYPIYNFKTEIRRIDLQKLNFIKADWVVAVKADLNLSGAKLSEIAGQAKVSDVVLTRKNGAERYEIKVLELTSALETAQNPNYTGGGALDKIFSLRSDVADIKVRGRFDLEQIPLAFAQRFLQHHPKIANDLGIKPSEKILNTQQFAYDIRIEDSKNLTKIFDGKLDTLKNIHLRGNFDNAFQRFTDSLTIPTIRYDDFFANDIELAVNSDGIFSNLDLGIYHANVGTTNFGLTAFQCQLVGDTVEIGVSADNFCPNLKVKKLQFDARIVPHQDSLYRINFKPNAAIAVMDDQWTISAQNVIYFGKEFLRLKDFELRRSNARISFSSASSRSLDVVAENMDISVLDPLIKDDRFLMSGRYKVVAHADDVFKIQGLKMTTTIDSFKIIGNHYGALRLDASLADLKSPVQTNLTIVKGDEKVALEGKYYLEAKDGFEKNYIDATVNLENYSFKAIQLLVPSGISDVKGTVDGATRVWGNIKSINTDGALRLRNAGVTVDYLKARLNVKDASVKITNKEFNATGALVYDDEGNPAKITGGLTHDRFDNFGLALRIESPRFLFLNTTRQDNPLYYGRAIGKGDVSFGGDFRKTDIRVRATAQRGTKITFPFASEQSSSKVSFINFNNKNLPKKNTDTATNTPTKVADLRGVGFDMDLTLTPEAECTLIFDENFEDNIKSFGEGDLQISYNRAGELRMAGDYRIVSGQYLFTLARVVQKNFAIKQGSSIRWQGTPFDAIIDINAEYQTPSKGDLLASPYNFIAEYLQIGGSSVQEEARRPTPVKLDLKLSGQLLRPEVNFGLAFPKLAGALRGYSDSKLRILEQDPNELNRQVFGLIVLNSFLPSDQLSLSSQLTAGAVNTAIESVSSLLNRALADYVTGVDLQIGYNLLQYDRISDIGRAEHQFRVRVSKSFFDDRLVVSGGAGVENSISGANGDVFLGGDAVIDYAITPDRRLKLRVGYTYDQILDGRRQRPAIGIRYKREFDNIRELFFTR